MELPASSTVRLQSDAGERFQGRMASPSDSPLHVSAIEGNVVALDALLSGGADIEGTSTTLCVKRATRA